MKKATKIIGAVLGLLLAAALFTGAAAAADEYNLGNVYTWKLYSTLGEGTHIINVADTEWTDGVHTVRFTRDPNPTYIGLSYIDGSNIVEGEYTHAEKGVVYRMTLKNLTAPLTAFVYTKDGVNARPVSNAFGDAGVPSDKALAFKREYDGFTTGIKFTAPGSNLTVPYIEGAVKGDPAEDYTAETIVAKEYAIMMMMYHLKALFANDDNYQFKQTVEAIKTVLAIEPGDIASGKTLDDVVQTVLKELGELYTVVSGGVDKEAKVWNYSPYVIAKVNELHGSIQDEQSVGRVKDTAQKAARTVDAANVIAGIPDVTTTNQGNYIIGILETKYRVKADDTYVLKAIKDKTPLASVKTAAESARKDAETTEGAALDIVNNAGAGTKTELINALSSYKTTYVHKAILAASNLSSYDALKGIAEKAKTDGIYFEKELEKDVKAFKPHDVGEIDPPGSYIDVAKYWLEKAGLKENNYVWDLVAGLDPAQATSIPTIQGEVVKLVTVKTEEVREKTPGSAEYGDNWPVMGTYKVYGWDGSRYVQVGPEVDAAKVAHETADKINQVDEGQFITDSASVKALHIIRGMPGASPVRLPIRLVSYIWNGDPDPKLLEDEELESFNNSLDELYSLKEMLSKDSPINEPVDDLIAEMEKINALYTICDGTSGLSNDEAIILLNGCLDELSAYKATLSVDNAENGTIEDLIKKIKELIELIKKIKANPMSELIATKIAGTVGGVAGIIGWPAVNLAYDLAEYNLDFATEHVYTDLTNVEPGVWTAQAYFKKDEINSPVILGQIASVAPDEILGKPQYFRIVSADDTRKLQFLENSVVQGGNATVKLTAPYSHVTSNYDEEGKYIGLIGGYRVVVENGIIPEGQAGVFPIEGTQKNTAIIDVDMTGSTNFIVRATSSDDVKVKLMDDSDNVVRTASIKVTSGKITANAASATTYIGNEAKISGTSDLGGKLNVFIKGPNFNFTLLKSAAEGGAITRIPIGREWEAKIDTGALSSSGKKPDAGNYTIYVAKLTPAGEDKAKSNTLTESNLGDSEYCEAYTTVVAALKQPFINIITIPSVVMKGSKLHVKGTAEGQPGEVMWYVFGNNYFNSNTTYVNDEGIFEIEQKVDVEDDKWQAGQYFLVIQHPMYDMHFNVGPKRDGERKLTGDILMNESGSFEEGRVLFNVNSRQTANAAQALCDALDNQNIDDMYVKASFFVVGPTSVISPIPDQVARGEKLTVSGAALGHANEVVSVELLSTAFTAVPKESVGSASFVSLVTRVDEKGLWSMTFDTSGLNADEYTVSVIVGQENPEAKKIRIIDNTAPTPIPTPTVQQTVQPTAQPTQTAASPVPIFGIVAGLGAAAALILRRR